MLATTLVTRTSRGPKTAIVAASTSFAVTSCWNTLSFITVESTSLLPLSLSLSVAALFPLENHECPVDRAPGIFSA